MQRQIIARAPGIVADGRDIGTVVAPGAQVKVFLTADGAARASRAAQNEKAADAVEIDSTRLSLDEVVGTIVGLVPQYLQESR